MNENKQLNFNIINNQLKGILLNELKIFLDYDYLIDSLQNESLKKILNETKENKKKSIELLINWINENDSIFKTSELKQIINKKVFNKIDVYPHLY
ncbi:hypothetical protein M1278_03625 [Candidatus Marsarchaeota archaeon]|nr:hypothetical protein [Candidatus Marsarchaeota archaeon]